MFDFVKKQSLTIVFIISPMEPIDQTKYFILLSCALALFFFIQEIINCLFTTGLKDYPYSSKLKPINLKIFANFLLNSNNLLATKILE